MTTKQKTPYAVNYRLNAYWTRYMNTDGTGFYTCKECHQTESLWNHITTEHKEEEQLEDRRNVGESSCNSGDGTDQRVQSLMFMMMVMVPWLLSEPWFWSLCSHHLPHASWSSSLNTDAGLNLETLGTTKTGNRLPWNAGLHLPGYLASHTGKPPYHWEFPVSQESTDAPQIGTFVL